MKKILAFDIGGTSCKYAFVENGSILNKSSFSTSAINKDILLHKIASIINAKCTDGMQVVISSPTAINSKTGYAYGISGIKDYGNFNLYNELIQRLTVSVKIVALNDANAALLGSISQSNTPIKSAVQINFGTGIGGAIFLDGKLLVGRNGFAGEFGYSKIWGEKNISKTISSLALKNRMSEELARDIQLEDIEKILLSNGKIKSFNLWLDKVGKFISSLIYFLNIEVVFIGGGISNNKFLFEKIKSSTIDNLKKENLLEILPVILPAYQGNDAAFYGCKKFTELE